jgi:hypothetical protein
MTTVTVDYIWQVIRESERSDESYFTNGETSIKAEAARLAQLRRVQSAAVASNSIADGAISPTLSAPDRRQF